MATPKRPLAHLRNGRPFGSGSPPERLLREAGCPKINLQIRTDNLEAIAFYERIGFLEDPVTSLGKRLIPDQ